MGWERLGKLHPWTPKINKTMSYCPCNQPDTNLPRSKSWKGHCGEQCWRTPFSKGNGLRRCDFNFQATKCTSIGSWINPIPTGMFFPPENQWLGFPIKNLSLKRGRMLVFGGVNVFASNLHKQPWLCLLFFQRSKVNYFANNKNYIEICLGTVSRTCSHIFEPTT